jgi:DNA-binding MarR family transcriptional regulator
MAASTIRSTALRSGPEVLAWERLLRANAAATRDMNAQLEREHGLTLNDFEVLHALARAPERRLRPVDLAERVVLTPSGITRLLAGLERAGLVSRATCPTDRRVSYAVLTDEGHTKMVAAAREHVTDIRALFGQRFTVAELRTLAALLARLPGNEHDVARGVE